MQSGNLKDRLVHVYKGTPGNHCVCDQALRQMPDYLAHKRVGMKTIFNLKKFGEHT